MELFVLFGFILILTHDYFPGVFSFILFLLGGSFLLCFLGSNPWLIPLVILALLGTLGYTVWKDKQEHTAWENRQSPKVEGYHPNNGWEYIETPTSSETSSQTPFNPQP